MYCFIKRFLAMCVLIFSWGPAHADIATVGHLHNYIRQRWHIEIPYNSGTNVVNMKYLMHAVDISNNLINGGGGTSYAMDESRATTNVVATGASDTAVEKLIRPEYKFFFTPATDENEYAFIISAAGLFVIDWGDGNMEVIRKDNTTITKYSHTYADGRPASAHEIKLGGRATRYITSQGTNGSAAIRFYDSTAPDAYQIKSMRGCLGCVFATVTDESVPQDRRQPRFYGTFANNKKLTSPIPENLFGDITGPVTGTMFQSTFENSGITGNIPEKLFAGLSGDATGGHNFRQTFSGCKGLTGQIPEKLFAGVSGPPRTWMFYLTFSGCTGLTGPIPAKLFAGISGAPADSMYYGTFFNCTGLTGKIPANLFGDIYGAPAPGMYYATFSGCSGLTGAIPAGLFGQFNGAPAENMFNRTFVSCTGLTGEIPANLFAGIVGKPASQMFSTTFRDCAGLSGSIPAGLFAGISGPAASSMFAYTFDGCSGLTGKIPEDLFGDINGDAASSMFNRTFYNCIGLTGPSARVGAPDKKEFLYERWPDTPVTCSTTNPTTGACTQYTGPSYQCYSGVTGLDDRENIPTNWGGPRIVE